jgi:hypothetical protein
MKFVRNFKTFVNERMQIAEGAMSELDLIAKEAKDFKAFTKEVFKEFKNLPKKPDTLKWLEELYNSAVNEAKMPNKHIGNDEIVFLKTKENSTGAQYNLYYKGYDIDAGGQSFGSEKDLKAFADNYILSNQWYNKLKGKTAKPLPESVNEAEVDLWSEVEGDFTQIYSKLNDLAEETTDSKWRKAIEGIIKALDVVETKMGQASSKLGVITVNEADKYESVNEGVRISLFDPNKNKILKSLSVDRNYKEAEKEVETLNKRLSASEKNKGYYWKITTIGESLNEGKYFIGTDEVNRDDVLEYKYKTKKSGYKWKQTNQAGGKFIEWKNVEKSLKILIKEYGKGNVVITGNTNGGDPVVDVFVKE